MFYDFLPAVPFGMYSCIFIRMFCVAAYIIQNQNQEINGSRLRNDFCEFSYYFCYLLTCVVRFICLS